MNQPDKAQLERAVVLAAREYGISTTLFRHTVGDRLGVNVTDMECLGLLFFKRLSTPTELSRYTGLSSGATTAMLHRLERAKLIRRQPNPHDRRGVLITPEPDAVSAVRPLFATTRQAQDALVASYSAEQLATIADFLNRFTAVWEQGRAQLQSPEPTPPAEPSSEPQPR